MDSKEKEKRLENFENYLHALTGNTTPTSGPGASVNTAPPVSVVGVNVQGTGADQTNPKLLEAHVLPLLNASSVKDLVQASERVQKALYRLGVFQDVALTFEPASAQTSDLIAVLTLPAVKRFSFQTGTNFGNGEGSGYIKGSVKNYLGLGEIVTVDTSTGTRTKSSQLINASLPLTYILPLEWRGEALAYASEKAVDWASHREQVRGATVRLSGPSASVGIDAVVRSIYVTGMNPGPTLMEQAGHTYKLSAFYNWTHDSRDHPFIPSSGSYTHLANQLALGSYPIFKSSLDYQRGLSLSRNISGTFGLRAGAVLPLGGLMGDSSHVMDRFYLGGALDIRGFRMNKLGPQEHSDSVGGDFVFATGLSLFSRVPRVKSDNLKLHAFFNAGTVRALPTSTQSVLDSFRTLSTSAGVGIVYSHQVARFELNIGMPLTAHIGEGVHPGLQFGLGLNFL